MRVLVASEPDEASMNQRAALLRAADWREDAAFEGRATQARGEWRIVTIRELHLDRDGLDQDLAASFGISPELVVYLSKHRSESHRPSLTVHPVGNAGRADLGGRPGTLVPSAPLWMTAALRRLRAEARDLPFEVTFEATHHGPFLDSPTFYIEQGSTEEEWRDLRASAAIARALVDLRPADAPVAIGLGGGHYVPRHTDLALARRIAFGHLLPAHTLEHAGPEILASAAEKTAGVRLAYLHRKSFGGPEARAYEERLAGLGLRVVREADLEPDARDKTS